MNQPRVLFAAAEVTPIAKVGGLADVVGALPIALRRLGFDVRIVLPRYEQIDPARLGCVERGDVTVTVSEGRFPVKVWEGALPQTDVPVFFLENDAFLSRGPIYFEQSAAEGSFVEFRRFLFYDLAVAAFLQTSPWQPDILHCHDWQTGLLPALTAGRYPSVFTIHNLAMQGKWAAKDILTFLVLDDASRPAWSFRDRNGDLNLLGTAIISADRVNTVSPSYAEEILTPALGGGLEELLTQHRQKLSGILNGIDTDRFDPAHDPAIVSYDAQHLERKRENRLRLLKRFQLTGEGPVFGFVGRLTEQKGSELIVASREFFTRNGASLVMLGKGLKAFEAEAEQLAKQLAGRAGVVIGFDATLAQQIYAGSDFFLMPSYFEPCGLGQLIALRYGTIPVVRATGGLRDTVKDIQGDGGTGITFDDYAPAGLAAGLHRALTLYRDTVAFRAVQQRAMAQDFSWNQSAQRYANLYRELLPAAVGRATLAV